MNTPALDSAEPSSFWRRHARKIIPLVFWIIAIAVYLWYTLTHDLTPIEAVKRLIGVLRSGFGPLIYLAVYALRPLILFPATVLTVTGGFVFGPFLGVIYTVLGSNTSAMIAYSVGRYFGGDIVQTDDRSKLQGYIERMRRNSFATILTMRFIFLPYDLVNYLAGFLRIDWRAFLLATVLGSIPGTIAFVLLGASVPANDNLDNLEFKLNPWALGASVAIFIVSIALSRYFKRREAQQPDV